MGMGVYRKRRRSRKRLVQAAIDMVEKMVVASYQCSVEIFELSGELISLLREHQETTDPTPTEYDLMVKQKDDNQ